MKKKMLVFFSILVVSVGVAINLNLSNADGFQLTNVALSNIEALADENLPPVTITCGQYEGACWVQGFTLKLCGPYSFYPCVFQGQMMYYCKNTHNC